MRRQICIGLPIVSIYVNKLHVHVLSIFSYPKESKKAKYIQILNIIKGLSAVTLFYSNLSNLPPLFRGYYRWHTLALLFLT